MNQTLLDSYDPDYWNKKVKKVSEISKKYGFPEYNEEFWENHVAGVISLIVEIFNDIPIHRRRKI